MPLTTGSAVYIWRNILVFNFAGLSMNIQHIHLCPSPPFCSFSLTPFPFYLQSLLSLLPFSLSSIPFSLISPYLFSPLRFLFTISRFSPYHFPLTPYTMYVCACMFLNAVLCVHKPFFLAWSLTKSQCAGTKVRFRTLVNRAKEGPDC